MTAALAGAVLPRGCCKWDFCQPRFDNARGYCWRPKACATANLAYEVVIGAYPGDRPVYVDVGEEVGDLCGKSTEFKKGESCEMTMLGKQGKEGLLRRIR